MLLSKVWLGNNKGAGFIRLNENKFLNLKLGSNLEIRILKPKRINFYCSLSKYKNYFGVYIPKGICVKNSLLGKTLRFDVKRLTGFPGQLGSDGRLYIPRLLAEKYNLSLNEIVLVNGLIGDDNINEYCKVKFRLKRKNREFFCMFSPNFKNRQGIFQIKKLQNRFDVPKLMNLLIKDKTFVVLSRNELLIFAHSSLLKLRMLHKIDSELVYYLGCYFADGTKKGYAWGIVASTFEQSRFYNKLYNRLVLNPQLKSEISITTNRQINNKEVINLWESESKLKISKVYNHLSKVKFSANRNEFGSLIVKDYRKCLLDYYNRLLHETIRQILETENRRMALDFILGVLEGDGSPSARGRGYISIASNKSDSRILEKILKILGLSFKVENYSGNKANVRVNALGILSKLQSISEKIFRYYPKRRKKFIQRFLGVGAVKHFFNLKRKTSAWVKAWLREEGFVDNEYALTQKGKKVKDILIKMKKEIE